MKINKIRIHNFGNFTDGEKDFSKMDLIGIIGRDRDVDIKSNGSGKSTFVVDAIRFCLYGKGRTRSIDDMVKEKSDGKMCVNINMNIGRQNVDIERSYIRGKKSKSSLIVKIDTVIVADGVIIGDKLIGEMIGIDYDTFIATCMFVQEKSDLFTSAISSKRKEYIRKIGNISIFDKAKKIISQYKNDIKSKIDTNDHLLDNILSKISNVDIIKLNFYITTMILNNSDFQDELNNLNKLQDVYKLNNEKIKNNEKTNILISNNNVKLNNVKDRILKMESKISYLNSQIKTCDDQLNGITEMFSVISDDDFKKIEDDKKNKELNIFSLIAKLDTYNNIIKPKIDDKIKEIDVWRCTDICMVCGSEISKINKDKKISLMEFEILEMKKNNGNIEESINQVNTELKKIIDIYDVEVDNRAKNNKLKDDRISLQEKMHVFNVNIKDELKRMDEEKQLLLDLEKENKFLVDNLNEVEIVMEDNVDFSDDIEKIQLKIDKNNIDVGLSKQKIKQCDDDIIESKKIKDELLILNDDFQLYKDLEFAFGKDGISNYMVENILHDIEYNTNQILDNILPEMRVFFETRKETKGGNIIDELNILIEYNGTIRGYETYSGGEKTMVNFAIRLSISNYLSKYNKMGIVVLDEVFGSLDDFNKFKMVSMLQLLKNEFNQIFVISHGEIKDLFPNIVTIERSRDDSRVI